MSIEPRLLRFLGGLIAGCACGALVMLALLYDRPGSAAVRKAGRLLGVLPAVVVAERPAVRAGNDREYAYGHDTHRDMMQPRLVPSSFSLEWEVRRGLEVERVATGFTYPVNLAFADRLDSAPDAPRFYVCELNGVVKYVANDGGVHVYADHLLNFTPIRQKKSSETGISGLTAVPSSPDLIITRAALDERYGLLTNEIVRLVSAPDGRSMVREVVIKRLGEHTSASNQVQQVIVGPDGMLYVSVGDAENHRLSLDTGRFGGKILRMTIDGEPCEDNPWFAGSPSGSPGKYLFAIGLRNVFDIDFHPLTGRLYGVDNGKNVDRMVEIRRGASYGWNGDFNSTRLNALWTWGPIDNVAPVGICFLDSPTLGDYSLGRCYVATYGHPGALGKTPGKSIWEFTVDQDSGLLTSTPTVILRYRGENQATVLGLAQGPDGIYFTDFFGESKGEAESATGSVWRLVPSSTNLSAAASGGVATSTLTPLDRGERIFLQSCVPCHRLDGFGGREGPDLSYLHDDLHRRLESPEYRSRLERLLDNEKEFFVTQRPRLRAVKAASGPEDLLRTWLKHHIDEPRFDNPFSKMPGFADVLNEEQRGDVIDFLMSRAGVTAPSVRPR